MKFQSKTKIGIFIGAVVILLVIGVLFFCIAKPSTSDEIKTSYLRGTFSIDYSDLNAVVGDADYVFVGTVASEEGTVWIHFSNQCKKIAVWANLTRSRKK